VFDGTDDRMDLNALGLFRNVNQGRVIAACSTSATAAQIVAEWTNGSGTSRTVVQSNQVAGRRLDSDSFVSAAVSVTTDPQIREIHADWSAGFCRGIRNGATTASTAYSSGAGSTSDTDSTFAILGGRTFLVYLQGPIASVIATNQDWSAALAARVRHCLAFTFMIPQEA
jgi:hypothetical protein